MVIAARGQASSSKNLYNLEGNSIKRFGDRILFPYDELWDGKDPFNTKLNLFYDLSTVSNVNRSGANSLVFTTNKRNLDEVISLHKQKFLRRKISTKKITETYNKYDAQIAVKLIMNHKDHGNEARLIFFNLGKDFLVNADQYNIITALPDHPSALHCPSKEDKINFVNNSSNYLLERGIKQQETNKKYKTPPENETQINQKSIILTPRYKEKTYTTEDLERDINDPKKVRAHTLSAYFCMKPIQGRNLNDQATNCLRPSFTEYLPKLLQRLESLKYFHERNIVNRDIKPANAIYSSQDKTIKTLDIGIGQQIGGLTGNHALGCHVGTPYYMSPSQCLSSRKKQAPSLKDDIYSMALDLLDYVFNIRRNFDITKTSKDAFIHEVIIQRDQHIKDQIQSDLFKNKIKFSITSEINQKKYMEVLAKSQKLLLNMLNFKPSDRPGILTVIRGIKEIMDILNIPYKETIKETDYDLTQDLQSMTLLENALEKFKHDFRMEKKPYQEPSLKQKMHSLNIIVSDKIGSHEYTLKKGLENAVTLIENLKSLFPSLQNNSKEAKLSEKIEYESLLSDLKFYYQDQHHIKSNIRITESFIQNSNICQIIKQSQELDSFLRGSTKTDIDLKIIKNKIKATKELNTFLVRFINLYLGVTRKALYLTKLRKAHYDQANGAQPTEVSELKSVTAAYKIFQEIAKDTEILSVNKALEKYNSILKKASTTILGLDTDQAQEWQPLASEDDKLYFDSNISLKQLTSKISDPVKGFTRAPLIPNLAEDK